MKHEPSFVCHGAAKTIPQTTPVTLTVSSLRTGMVEKCRGVASQKWKSVDRIVQPCGPVNGPGVP